MSIANAIPDRDGHLPAPAGIAPLDVEIEYENGDVDTITFDAELWIAPSGRRIAIVTERPESKTPMSDLQDAVAGALSAAGHDDIIINHTPKTAPYFTINPYSVFNQTQIDELPRFGLELPTDPDW